MKLLTAEIKKKLPPLYSQENKKPEETPIVVKFFDPAGSWNWYVTEGSPVNEDGKVLESWNDPAMHDVLFFGMVHGFEVEAGYFCLNELQSARSGPFKLGIERDMYFGKHTLAEVQERGHV